MSKQQFAADYIDVATRITQFRETYPGGSLRPADPAVPYRIEQVGEQTVIVVVAAAYRDPGDQLPGIGMAQEPFPGKTPYTKGSELQNAETSAWGRAIVAALAADTKRGIASAEEITGRDLGPLVALKREIWALADRRGWIEGDSYQRLSNDFARWNAGGDITAADEDTLRAYLDHLQPKTTMQRGTS